MNNNSITAEGCVALTSAFNSNPSNLIELDLSGNILGNTGIEKICPLLENTQCILEKLKCVFSLIYMSVCEYIYVLMCNVFCIFVLLRHSISLLNIYKFL